MKTQLLISKIVSHKALSFPLKQGYENGSPGIDRQIERPKKLLKIEKKESFFPSWP
jgi:hypothetical protein